MNDRSFTQGFLKTLVEDVDHAWSRAEQDDTPTHCREAIRTTFAAIEGLVWLYREHIRSAARQLESLTPLANFALQEKTYMVGENGGLVEQIKFVPLTTMIRLTTKIAQEACPGFAVDFGQAGWSDLKRAIGIRNRLTHPKSTNDLTIEAVDLGTAKSGFFWLLETVVDGMSAANVEITRWNRDARALIDKLKGGDEEALKLYHETLKDLDD